VQHLNGDIADLTDDVGDLIDGSDDPETGVGHLIRPIRDAADDPCGATSGVRDLSGPVPDGINDDGHPSRGVPRGPLAACKETGHP